MTEGQSVLRDIDLDSAVNILGSATNALTGAQSLSRIRLYWFVPPWPVKAPGFTTWHTLMLGSELGGDHMQWFLLNENYESPKQKNLNDIF